jgi:hypothetical protein
MKNQLQLVETIKSAVPWKGLCLPGLHTRTTEGRAKEHTMTRYMIVRTPIPEEGSFWDGLYLEFVESSNMDLGPDPTPEQVVENHTTRVLHYRYRNIVGRIPEFHFYPTDRTSEDAEWLVYREAANGDFLCAGGVRAEEIKPSLEEIEPERCQRCGFPIRRNKYLEPSPEESELEQCPNCGNAI